MKVLHLLYSNCFSGAENVACQIIRLMRSEPDMDMVYCSRDGQIREALEERGISFVPVMDLTVREVKRVVREQKPDVIHAHDMHASFVAALSCSRIPLISHIHNNSFNSRGLSAKSVAYLLAGWKAQNIFWVSKSSFDGYIFHNLFKKKSAVLYNMIDIDALYQKMECDKKMYAYDAVYIGRLTPQKGPKRLMRVLKLLSDKIPAVKIAVIGTGELEKEVKDLAREYGLLGNVVFLGFQPNPLKILRDSKAMVMTSLWEGTPICALEALALGVPVVGTPTDGLTDLIKTGENGYLSNDDIELSEKLADVIQDPDLRRRLSKQALEDARYFNDIPTYRAKILKAYRQGNSKFRSS